MVLRNFKKPQSKTKKGRGKKIDLSNPETSEVNQYRSHVYNYNQFLLKHCISLDLDDEHLNTLALEKRFGEKSALYPSKDNFVCGSNVLIVRLTK